MQDIPTGRDGSIADLKASPRLSGACWRHQQNAAVPNLLHQLFKKHLRMLWSSPSRGDKRQAVVAKLLPESSQACEHDLMRNDRLRLSDLLAEARYFDQIPHGCELWVTIG